MTPKPPQTEPQSHPDNDDAVADNGMYHLLARLWLYEVDEPLLIELTTAPMRELYLAAGGRLPSNTDSTAHTIDDLAVDYCQLFVGPQQAAPPYQSVWLTGEFQGKPVESMQQFIDVIRFNVKRLPSGTMLDHLGTQLLVMAAMNQALTSEFIPQTLLEIRSEFFRRHLLWPARLLAAAEKNSQTPFYRSLATVTREFLNWEGRRIA